MSECWICMDEDKWCHIALEGQERRERWMEVKNKAEGKREGDCMECGGGSWEGDSVSYELQSERPLSGEAWAAVETVPRKYGNHLLTIALRLQIINLEFRVIVTKIQNLAVSHSFLSARLCFIWNGSFSVNTRSFSGRIAASYLPGRNSRQALISCLGRLIPHQLQIPHIADTCCQFCSCVQISNLQGSNWPTEQSSSVMTTSACVCLYITVWYSSVSPYMIEGVNVMLCVRMHWENQLNISSCMSVCACDWVCVYLLIEIGLTGWEGTDVSMCRLPARLNKANCIVSLSKSTKIRDLQNRGLSTKHTTAHMCTHT